MRERHRHLIDENKKEEDDVYMYPANMTPNERDEFRAAYRASKASE